MRTDEAIPEPASDFPIDSKLAEEIQRALDMMRRVKTAQSVREEGDAQNTPGNTYMLPEPLVLRVSGSTDRD